MVGIQRLKGAPPGRARDGGLPREPIVGVGGRRACRVRAADRAAVQRDGGLRRIGLQVEPQRCDRRIVEVGRRYGHRARAVHVGRHHAAQAGGREPRELHACDGCGGRALAGNARDGCGAIPPGRRNAVHRKAEIAVFLPRSRLLDHVGVQGDHIRQCVTLRIEQERLSRADADDGGGSPERSIGVNF